MTPPRIGELASVGVVHPGEMGPSLAIALASTGNPDGREVLWAGDGRSLATRARAERAGLVDVGTIEDLARVPTWWCRSARPRPPGRPLDGS